jgi:hypothetical protein
MPELINGEHTQILSVLREHIGQSRDFEKRLLTEVERIDRTTAEMKVRGWGWDADNWQGGLKGDVVQISRQLVHMETELPKAAAAALLAATQREQAGHWSRLSTWGKTAVGTVVIGVLIVVVSAAFVLALHLTQVSK